MQIVGRGVGHWATNGDMVAVELDVYQYAAAAAVIPEKPHRFRGVRGPRLPRAICLVLEVFELNGIARGPQQGVGGLGWQKARSKLILLDFAPFLEGTGGLHVRERPEDWFACPEGEVGPAFLKIRTPKWTS